MSNEAAQTKLPSQVEKIGKDAEALAIETGIKPGSKPLKPVETSSAHINEPAKVDPSDYKTRYSNYKATTDVTIAGLRQELAATNATINELRNQVAQKQEVVASTTTAVKEESLAGTRKDPAYLAYLDKLPESIKTEYAEDWLFDQFIIQTTAGGGGGQSEDLAALNSKIDNVVQFQEKTKYELYEEAMDSAFPNDEWIKDPRDKQWNDFCGQRVSAVDSRTYGQLVKEGSQSHTASTVIWVLNQYKQHLSTLGAGDSVGDDAATILESQLTPDEAGGGSDPVIEINAQSETFKQSDVDKFFVEAATTKKYTAEEAKAIEIKIIAAHAAGKILPG